MSTSVLVFLAGAALSIVVAIGAVRAALSVLNSLVSAAVTVGASVMAMGLGVLIVAVVYVANLVYEFVPS